MAEEKKRNGSVDFLKGLSMLFIIILHFGWQNEEPRRFLFVYWAEMAVPIFMILSGYVFSLSFQRKKIERMAQAYECRFIAEKLVRFIVPFAVAYFVEVFYRYFYNGDRNLGFFEWVKMFLMGGIGPGSYYVPILIQFIFIFPLIYFLIKKTDYIGLAVAFALCFLYEVLQKVFGMNPEVYRLIIIRYLFAISAGCYMTVGKNRLKPVWACVSMLLGGLWITLINYLGYSPKVVMPVWAGTGFIAVLWVIPAVYYLINKGIRFKTLEFIGRASYNIFLIQLVVFAYGAWFVYIHVSGQFLQFLILAAGILITGILFYLIESRITGRIIGLIRKKN